MNANSSNGLSRAAVGAPPPWSVSLDASSSVGRRSRGVAAAAQWVDSPGVQAPRGASLSFAQLCAPQSWVHLSHSASILTLSRWTHMATGLSTHGRPEHGSAPACNRCGAIHAWTCRGFAAGSGCRGCLCTASALHPRCNPPPPNGSPSLGPEESARMDARYSRHPTHGITGLVSSRGCNQDVSGSSEERKGRTKGPASASLYVGHTATYPMPSQPPGLAL